MTSAEARGRRAVWWSLLLLGAACELGRAGVRVGPWLMPAIGAWPWIAVALAALFWLPARRSDRPWRLGLLCALTLALAWPLAAWHERARREERLPARIGRLSRPHEAPTLAAASLAALADGTALRALAGRRNDLDLQVAGFLIAPETGTYELQIECGDTCALEIDGRVVVGAPAPRRARAALDAGAHPARVVYRQAEGRSLLALRWNRPAWLEALPIGPAFANDPGPDPVARVKRREWEALLLLAAALAWWILAGAAVVELAQGLGGLRGRALRATSAYGAALRAHPYRWPCAASFALTLVWLIALEAHFRPLARERVYFQAWTSEYMMQTLSVADLRAEPLRSLWYDHIQPPMFDALRAVLVALHPRAEGQALMVAVDRGLYACWTFVAAALVALACLWLCRIAGARFGVAAALLLALHPAVVFYATFLDGTLLSALGLLWLYYELWKIVAGGGSPGRLAASVVALFFTRSIVQWPFLAVLGASLVLAGVDRRRVLRVIVPAGIVMGLFLLKQYALFGVTITSTFGPDSFCKGLASFCHGTTPVPLPDLPGPGRASALRRTEKLNGEYNYNQLAWLRRSFSQMQEYKALLRSQPASQTLAQFAYNLKIWLRPSSRHSEHAIVDRLPWRRAYDAVFSGLTLAGLLLASAGAWVASSGVSGATLRRGLGSLLPGLYVAAVAIAFESGENMRYKFVLEPVLFVWIASQLHLGVRAAAMRLGAAA